MRRWRTTVLIAMSVLIAACGSTDSSDLSQQAQEGRDLAMAKGCAACHGEFGEGGVGPVWTGLAGSDVELADGSVITADAEYLRRSITDPEAQVVAGFTITMPTTKLADSEVSALVAYIQELE